MCKFLNNNNSFNSYLCIELQVNFIFVLVVKRSADLHIEAKFAQFSGKGITEIDIVNLEDTVPFEKSKAQ